MPITPRNESEDPVPREGIYAGDVARRYEITVEREFLAIKGNFRHDSSAHCSECGKEVLSRRVSNDRKEPFPENHSVFSILSNFLHFSRARFPKRLRSGPGGSDEVPSQESDV